MDTMESRGSVKTEMKDAITIAVDFGTTYSGVAWHWAANPGVREVLVNWPDSSSNTDGFTDEKVSTRLAYMSYERPSAWGVQVENSQARYQEFKLLLGGARNLKTTKLTTAFSDPLGLPVSDRFNATKLTIDYLRCLKEHALYMIGNKIHAFTVEHSPIEWVLTIPAIWSDAQKQSTRFSAEKAGMIGKLCLVAEPEAAIIHALETINTKEVGDTFILCDCGGGTVDLITYVIQQFQPLKVKEVVRGDGDRCGGVYIDRVFSKYLTNNFSHCHGWSNAVLHDAIGHFETVTKRKFDDTTDQVIIRVPGLINDRSKNIKKEKATIPSADVRAVFEPVVNIIKRLIQEQVATTKAKQHKVTAVLLVGGFSQSPYLKKIIQQTVGLDIKVLQVTDGRVAVVNGALLKALNDADPEHATVEVTSRIARKNYGISKGIEYNPKTHAEAQKYWVEIEKKTYVQIAHWLIRKDRAIQDKYCDPLVYHEAWPINAAAPVFRINILACDGPPTNEHNGKLPHYADKALHVATLEVDLKKIPKRFLEIQYDRWNREAVLFYCFPTIEVTYKSAGLEFSLWYKDVCYGKVDAKFE